MLAKESVHAHRDNGITANEDCLVADVKAKEKFFVAKGLCGLRISW